MNLIHCNSCWKEFVIKDSCFITSCLHSFCESCATNQFNNDRICPICESSLTNKGSIYGITIESSFEKTIQLFGLNPKELFLIVEKAIDFWYFQSKLYKENECRKLEMINEQCQRLKEGFIKRAEEYENKFDLFRKQIDVLEKESESDKKEIVDLSEKCAEKTRQKRKLEELYESLKKKLEEQQQTTNGFQLSSSYFNTVEHHQSSFFINQPNSFVNPTHFKQQSSTQSNQQSQNLNQQNVTKSFPQQQQQQHHFKSSNINLPSYSIPASPILPLPKSTNPPVNLYQQPQKKYSTNYSQPKALPISNENHLKSMSNNNNNNNNNTTKKEVKSVSSSPSFIANSNFDKFSFIRKTPTVSIDRVTHSSDKQINPIQQNSFNLTPSFTKNTTNVL